MLDGLREAGDGLNLTNRVGGFIKAFMSRQITGSLAQFLFIGLAFDFLGLGLTKLRTSNRPNEFWHWHGSSLLQGGCQFRVFK